MGGEGRGGVVKCGEGRGGVVCWREMGGEGWWGWFGGCDVTSSVPLLWLFVNTSYN